MIRLIHELEVQQIELEMINGELINQNHANIGQSAKLKEAKQKVLTLDKNKSERAAELIIANKELIFQKEEKAKRAAELVLTNKELVFHAEIYQANKQLFSKNQALFESEKRYRALVEWEPLAIIIHRNGIIVYANPCALKLFGSIAMDELVGHPVIERVHPRYHQAMQEHFGMAVYEGQNIPKMEKIYLKLDGTQIHVEVEGKFIIYEGEQSYYMAITDISKHKQILQDKYYQRHHRYFQNRIRRHGN